MPERGDVVIVTPPGRTPDYIKRVIGLPGDTIEVSRRPADPQRQAGHARVERPPAMIPVDANVPCDADALRRFPGARTATARSIAACRSFRETLPNGRTYDTIDVGHSAGRRLSRRITRARRAMSS